MNLNRKSHWEKVYAAKKPSEVSWYQAESKTSLEIINSIGLNHATSIIDVGGGASTLVDKLLDEGFGHLTVLDISSKALDYAKERLGERAENVTWIEADVTGFHPPDKYGLWHDRAVFHFLTDPEDRKKYVQSMEKTLSPGGHLIISTFAIDGPLKCSGLDIERYSLEKMKGELRESFEFVKKIDDVHVTPWNTEQKFTYFYFRKLMERAKE